VGHKEEANYTPTPEEIVEVCRKIREGWSEDKWAKQSGATPWALPQLSDPGATQDRIQ